MMKKYYSLQKVCLSVFALWLATFGHASQVENLIIVESNFSVVKFVAAVKSNHVVAPVIHSKWYVDKIIDPDTRDRERGIRDAGKVLAERLDGWSESLGNLRSPEEITMECKSLLDLSDWLAASKGYGNLIIAFRCQDIASVGIGRLAVDLNYSYQAVSGLLSRLEASWQSPVARAEVLNDEAKTKLFDVSGKNYAAAQKELTETWQNGEQTVHFQNMRQQSNQVLDLVERRIPSDIDANDLEDLRKNIFAASSLSSDVKDFFTDTSSSEYPARPWTVSRLWDIKRHSFFVGGDLQSTNARKLDMLLRFRQRVGNFPDQLSVTPEQAAAEQADILAAAKKGIRIVSREKAYGSARKAAFAAAWRNVSTTEPAIGRLACDVYESILAGDFVDADTHERRLTNQVKAANVLSSGD